MPVPEPETFTALKRVRSSARQLFPKRSRRHGHRERRMCKVGTGFPRRKCDKNLESRALPADQPFIRTVNVIGKRSSVLPDLTDEDREKLGVLLGDRRKMLR